ncbi:MAG: hypothetical protein GC168_03600 [Candidatus Hydrogenedens sp.]|nr:hypothetical protein [Candidatus Hydrogenedens sp.]
MRRRRGYILFETLMSMTLLSITMLTIHTALQQAIESKGLARDYTTVRFLMEGVFADLEMEHQLHEMHETGRFEPPNERFSYVIDVDKIEVPRPELPASINPLMQEKLAQNYQGWMPRVKVEITWSRAGNERTRVGETLLPPQRLWLPPETQEGAVVPPFAQ